MVKQYDALSSERIKNQKYEDCLKDAEKLFKMIFGEEMFNRLNVPHLENMEWNGCDIDAYPYNAYSFNIKQRLEDIDFIDKPISKFELFFESCFKLGFQQCYSSVVMHRDFTIEFMTPVFEANMQEFQKSLQKND